MSRTRRRFLAGGLAGLSIAVAGCSSSDDNGTDGNSTGNETNSTTDSSTGNETDDTAGEIPEDVGTLAGTGIDWPTFRRNRYNTAYAEGDAITEPTVDWEYETGGDVWGSPVVADGTVYVPSYDRYLHAISLDSGAREWRFEMEMFADATPGVADGTVVCGSFDNYVYAVDAATGEQVWRYDTGGIVRSSPTIVDGTVYIGAHCQSAECAQFTPDEAVGELLALDLATGELLWSFETTAGIVATPAVAENAVFTGASTGELTALDRATGETLWSYAADALISSSPAVVDGTIYLGDVRGTFHAVDAVSGTAEWTHESEQTRNFPSSPAVDEETVYIGGNYDGATSAGVLAFDRSGGLDWSTNLSSAGRVGSSPLVLDDHVYIGVHGSDAEGGFYGVRTDGTESWSMSVAGEGVGASPAVVDGSLVFAAVNGRVVSVS
jgi:outer membrane protein assembly factor BamB